jgi:hypothetical protein
MTMHDGLRSMLENNTLRLGLKLGMCRQTQIRVVPPGETRLVLLYKNGAASKTLMWSTRNANLSVTGSLGFGGLTRSLDYRLGHDGSAIPPSP